MKRILLAISVAAAAVLSVSAQNPYRPVFGFRAAVDVNVPGKWKSPDAASSCFDIGAGATVGAVCRLPFLQALYVEPGVSLFYDQFSYKNLPNGADYGNVNRFGVRIPFVLGYNFKFYERTVMTVYTGPEFNVAFAGSYSNGKAGENPFNSDQALRRFEMGWKIGLGVPVKNFLISVEGCFGITDMAENALYNFRENRVTAGVTYYF